MGKIGFLLILSLGLCLGVGVEAYGARMDAQEVDQFIRSQIEDTPAALLSYIPPTDSLLSGFIADLVNFTQRPTDEFSDENLRQSLRILRRNVNVGRGRFSEYAPSFRGIVFNSGNCATSSFFASGSVDKNDRLRGTGVRLLGPEKIEFRMYLYWDCNGQIKVDSSKMSIVVSFRGLSLYLDFPALFDNAYDGGGGLSNHFQAAYSFMPGSSHSVFHESIFRLVRDREDPEKLLLRYNGEPPDSLRPNAVLIPFGPEEHQIYERQRQTGILPIGVFESEGLNYNDPALMPLLYYSRLRNDLLNLTSMTRALFGMDYTEGDFLPFHTGLISIKPRRSADRLTEDDIYFSHAEVVVRLIGANPALKSILIAGTKTPILDEVALAYSHYKDFFGERRFERMQAALAFAVGHGAKIINVSLSSQHMFDNSDEAKREIRQEIEFWTGILRAHPDILFVVAAGNDEGLNLDGPFGQYGHYTAPIPQRFGRDPYENLILVASCKKTTDESGDEQVVLEDYSNFGPRSVDVCTQGSYELPLRWFDGERSRTSFTIKGTSFAAPRIVRNLGEILLNNPQFTTQQAKDQLFQSAQRISSLSNKIDQGRFIDVQD